MYQVPVNRPPRVARRRLPLVGALQGAGYGFVLALAFGAALGVLILIGIMVVKRDIPYMGSGPSPMGALGLMLLWMYGVMLIGGVPAAIIGFVTGLIIGVKLRRLPYCYDELAKEIGQYVSTNIILLLNFIALTGLLFVDDIVALAWLLGSLLVFLWLPCLIYSLTARWFATRLYRHYLA